MRILSNTMVTLFFLFIIGLMIHGMAHTDGIGIHQKVEHSR